MRRCHRCRIRRSVRASRLNLPDRLRVECDQTFHRIGEGNTIGTERLQSVERTVSSEVLREPIAVQAAATQIAMEVEEWTLAISSLHEPHRRPFLFRRLLENGIR